MKEYQTYRLGPCCPVTSSLTVPGSICLSLGVPSVVGYTRSADLPRTGRAGVALHARAAGATEAPSVPWPCLSLTQFRLTGRRAGLRPGL